MTTDQLTADIAAEERLNNAELRLRALHAAAAYEPDDYNQFESIYLTQLITHNQARVDRLRAALGLV